MTCSWAERRDSRKTHVSCSTLKAVEPCCLQTRLWEECADVDAMVRQAVDHMVACVLKHKHGQVCITVSR
jgi:hypothetical protein